MRRERSSSGCARSASLFFRASRLSGTPSTVNCCYRAYFRATGLRHGDADREHEEQQDLVTRDFALSEVERMICDGQIKDATTVAALGLLRLKGLL